ncbi:hypothetical protein BV898_17510 [Hypsibius exemplaris]|uniref:Uncharacterized protein n=1 Tax=Hypsibius exemplaris TaxID=2072580 RepID=A0A9X6RMI9_HYPEX|nr:hypothetical protein BV898_17510 [Hypsibius exemplaris]
MFQERKLVVDVGERLADRLAEVLTITLSGTVPDDIYLLLYGSALTALNKNDGGIRPITCGNTVRQLLGKIVSRYMMLATRELGRPQQLGYGAPGGEEVVVPAPRAFLLEEGET